jgi:hypothetical protein
MAGDNSLDRDGVEGTPESIADSAGEGIVVRDGVTNGGTDGDTPSIPKPRPVAGVLSWPTMSMATLSSFPFSTIIVLGSRGDSAPRTPCRSS